MGKMHELLAVEQDLEDVFKKVLKEAKTTFSKHQNLFTGMVRTLEMFDDEENNKVGGIKEKQERETTVNEKLNYIATPIENYIDCLLQKDLTNKQACADIDVNGVILGQDIPATFLLTMEKRLKFIRDVFESIPTLEKGVKWEDSSSEGKGVYETKEPKVTEKTQKFKNSIIVAQATKEHRAQVEVWDDTRVVGKYLDTYTSGKITSGRKSIYLNKIDNLIQAVKQARMRANSTEVVKDKIGSVFMDYILSE